MTKVMKKGGREQKFAPEKIKRAVDRAAKEAKLPPAERRKLVREVALPVIRAVRKRKTVKTSVIRKLVVAKLQKKAKKVAAVWRKYERRHKKKRATKKRIVRRKTHHKKRRTVHHRRKRR